MGLGIPGIDLAFRVSVFACHLAYIWEFPKIRGTLFGVLIIRILLFKVLYLDPLFSETPILLKL